MPIRPFLKLSNIVCGADWATTCYSTRDLFPLTFMTDDDGVIGDSLSRLAGIPGIQSYNCERWTISQLPRNGFSWRPLLFWPQR